MIEKTFLKMLIGIILKLSLEALEKLLEVINREINKRKIVSKKKE